MIFLLGITWMFYYLIKGVSVKQVNALLIITTVVWVLNLLVLIGMESSLFKLFMTTYMVFSFIDYLSIRFTGKNIVDLPWMSGIMVKNKEVFVKYNIFRPFTVILINIFLVFKKLPMIGIKDTISIDVNTADKTQIKIIL
ncbi:MAG: hypothetical protein KAS62_05460 [Candidatus Delongbacteria bacterium]|nr:hypothetical protein [Candidatus Delongbacteria bacterium]